MNLDQTYTIDFNNLSFYDGDFRKSDDFSDLIYENDGSVCREEEWICFNPAGNDDVFITIEYTNYRIIDFHYRSQGFFTYRINDLSIIKPAYLRKLSIH